MQGGIRKKLFAAEFEIDILLWYFKKFIGISAGDKNFIFDIIELSNSIIFCSWPPQFLNLAFYKNSKIQLLIKSFMSLGILRLVILDWRILGVEPFHYYIANLVVNYW